MFKGALTGFIRIKKLTYTMTEAKKVMFLDRAFTRSDILLIEDNQYMIICLN